MSKSSNQVTSAVRRALIWSALAAAGAPAMAQDQPATTQAPVDEVIVTGSRIQSPNVTSVSPVTTVSAADITATGLTRTEDILNNLPMVFAGQNSTVSNGSDGTATVNLRGLGPQRTLVLVNGRRLGPGPGTGSNISDINEVPAALIERVDILTGGASSVYGADAVAGVVNFVLNTKFQGVRIDAGYDYYQHTQHNAVAGVVSAAGDALPDHSVNTGFGKNVAVLMGSNFADDRGNATFYATYDQKAPVLQSKYDYSACVLDATKAGSLACGGSGTSAKNGAGGYFQAYANKANGGGALFTNTVDGKTGAFRPFTANDLYNFGPLNFYQTPNTRWTAGSFLTYDLNPHVTAYSEVMFERNETSAQIAASGDFFNTSFIPCSDPLLTADEKSQICSPANLAAQSNPGGPTATGLNVAIGRRNVEGGGRVATFRTDNARLVIGARGDITDGWKYDAYAQRNTVDFSNTNQNYFSNANINKALDVIKGPALLADGVTPNPLAGQAECQSVYDGSDPACVPWNIWSPNSVTAAALKYLSIPLLIEATTTEEVVSGSVTGDLGKYGVKLPTAADGVIMNFGAEWRSESAAFVPDYQELLGNAAGAGGPTAPVSGAFTVREVFTEASIPLVNNAPLAQSLSADLGYRYSSYSEGFKTNTYKMGLQWEPIQDIRARASYQRAVRAPNIFELYQAAAVGLDGSQDPCSGATPVATQAQCALTGVTATEYGHIGANPAAQYNGFIGGNPNLKPETSDTYSAGLVLQPQVAPGLVVSVDYFNIKVKDTIGPIGEDTLLANCIATGDPIYCGGIHRDVNGSLWKSNAGFVVDTNVNFGSLVTKGIDLKGDYKLALPAYGSLAFSLEGTKLISLTTQPLTGGPAYNCEGLFGTVCGAPNPGWRHVLNTTWSTPWDALDITLRWRYLGSATSELGSSDPQLAGNSFPLGSRVPAYNYLDMSAMFNVYKGIRLQLGINNLTDKDPPIINSNGGGFGSNCPTITGNGSSCNGNTFPGTYDALGRFLFAHVTAQF